MSPHHQCFPPPRVEPDDDAFSTRCFLRVSSCECAPVCHACRWTLRLRLDGAKHLKISETRQRLCSCSSHRLKDKNSNDAIKHNCQCQDWWLLRRRDLPDSTMAQLIPTADSAAISPPSALYVEQKGTILSRRGHVSRRGLY